ncbi:hypothetical protein M3Y97_01065400 [Aphelenchoides bicaudatus]|nr:hypothetical protein M3Y97_01065400 [Aphelenchoides bicaudatus]
MNLLQLLICLLITLINTINCSPLPGPPIFTPSKVYPPVCYLPPDSGPTSVNKHGRLATILTQVTDDCYPFSFMFQSCSQNKNNFASKQDCKTQCQVVERTKETRFVKFKRLLWL